VSSPTQAVFLSYASQDSEAAQRICDALRARGIEVWFDQSELRGGDAWDQKIRRQIKDCALFIPVISANTNARGEGYFRLEWKLGVDRSHLMADDEPFIFPVVIDKFPDEEARVPDRFREVQWARLGAKDTPESIAARVARLLEGEAEKKPAARKEKRRGRHPYFWPIVGILLGMFFVTRPMWHTKREPKAPTEAAAPAAPVSEAAQLARRAIAMTLKIDSKRGEFAAAADLARKATEVDPQLAFAWGARARVEAAWLHRNWDLSAARRQAAQDFAKRAIALDPEEPNALYAQAMVLRFQRAFPEGVALFQRALKVDPGDNTFRRGLAGLYRNWGKNDEAIAVYDEALRRDPSDTLSYYSLSILYAGYATLKDNDYANVDKALGYIDKAIAVNAFSGALLQKAAVLAAWKGDMPGALAALDRAARLPLEDTTEDRAIFFEMWIPLLDRQPQRALAAAARTTTTYFADAVVAQPVAWLKALAYREQGNESLAAEEWRAAEAVLRARLNETPESLSTQAELAATLAMLGRKEAAAKQFARFEATQREQGRTGTLNHVRYYAAAGDAKRAVAAIRENRKAPSIWLTDHVLRRDPWYDAIRGKPEFKALLEAPEAKK
jgi:tetratricopeptide (TPR) repeat protein